VLELVKKIIEHPDNRLRGAAHKVLHNFLPSKKVEELAEETTVRRYVEYTEMEELGTLLRASSPNRRPALIEIAVHPLIEKLQSLRRQYRDPAVVLPVIRLLSKIGDARFIEPIVDTRIDTHPSYEEKISALRKMTSPAAIEKFFSLLEQGKGTRVVLEHMYFDGNLSEEIAAPCLIRAFDAESPGDLTEGLIAALSQTRSDKVKLWIVYCLGKLGDERALRPLIGVLADDSILHTSSFEAREDRNYRFFIERIQSHLVKGLKRITLECPHVLGITIELLSASLNKKSDNYGKMLLVLGLAAVGDRTAVSHLMNILTDQTLHPKRGNTIGATETLERMQNAVITGLKRITGKAFSNIEEWDTWWKSAKDKDTQFSSFPNNRNAYDDGI
jgi:hypothetical protein